MCIQGKWSVFCAATTSVLVFRLPDSKGKIDFWGPVAGATTSVWRPAVAAATITTIPLACGTQAGAPLDCGFRENRACWGGGQLSSLQSLPLTAEKCWGYQAQDTTQEEWRDRESASEPSKQTELAACPPAHSSVFPSFLGLPLALSSRVGGCGTCG